MRVLVCGGRDYENYTLLSAVLSGYPITTIIHGAARGADSLAGRYAEDKGIRVMSFRAEWDKFGKSAGAIRNAKMLEAGRPELVIAFPGGRGTSDMVRKSKAAGVRVVEV